MRLLEVPQAVPCCAVHVAPGLSSGAKAPDGSGAQTAMGGAEASACACWMFLINILTRAFVKSNTCNYFQYFKVESLWVWVFFSVVALFFSFFSPLPELTEEILCMLVARSLCREVT